MNDLKILQNRAIEIRKSYSELNSRDGRAEWKGKEFMMGFVGDVGDLTKLVMAKENLRGSEDLDAKLAHELSDCLWSILILADEYDVDLQNEFLKTMDEIEQRIIA